MSGRHIKAWPCCGEPMLERHALDCPKASNRIRVPKSAHVECDTCANPIVGEAAWTEEHELVHPECSTETP